MTTSGRVVAVLVPLALEAVVTGAPRLAELLATIILLSFFIFCFR